MIDLSMPDVARRTRSQGPPLFADAMTGHRSYSPSLGRWHSRDPAEDLGFVRSDPHAISRTHRTPPRTTGHLGGDGVGPYCFGDNDPQQGADLLGLSWFDIRRSAGSKCCPACDYDNLKSVLAQQNTALACWKKPELPDTKTTLGDTRCEIWSVGQKYVPVTRFYVPTESCIGWCAVLHEEVHRQQCDGYVKGEWAKDLDSRARLEIPATEIGIKCLRVLVKMAEKAAKEQGGDMRKACWCCYNPP